jgi:hypothetical protein
MTDSRQFNKKINVVNKEYKNNLVDPPVSNVQKLKEAGNKAMEMYKSLDMFGKPITLKYTGQDVFKSLIGATVSLSALGAMFIYFVASFLFFIQRKNPIFTFISETRPIPPSIIPANFTEKMDWIAGIDIVSPEGSASVLDSKVFNISVKWYTNFEGGNPYSRNAIFVPCNNSKSFYNKTILVNGKNITYAQMYKMDTARCFRLDKFINSDGVEDQLQLEGAETSDTYDFVKIQIRACNKENTEGIECSDSEEIANIMDNTIVRYYYTQKQFLTDSKVIDPITDQVSFFKFPLQQYFNKQIKMSVQNNSVSDYYNVLNSEPSQRFIFSYEDYTTDVNFVTAMEFGVVDFLGIELKASPNINSFTRKFMNIKEFFISIVGIMNGIWAAGAAVGQIFNTMLLKVDLINKSFYLIEDENAVKDGKKKDGTSIKNEGASVKIDLNGDELSKINNKGGGGNKVHDGDISGNSELEKTNRSLIGKKGQKIKDIDELDDKEDGGTNPDNTQQNHPVVNTEARGNSNIQNPWWNDSTLIIPNHSKKFKKFKMSFTELVFQMLPCCKHNKVIMGKKKIFEDCGKTIEAYFDIERIIGILREYQDLRNVVLSSDEYKILKQLTTPKIEIVDDEVNIKKAEKINISEKELKNSYSEFIHKINKLVKAPYISNVEYNLLHLHRLSHLDHDNNKKKDEKK